MTRVMVLLKVRTPFIPAAVLQKREATMEVEKVRRKLERDLELEQGRDYIIDLRSKCTGECWLLCKHIFMFKFN